MAKALELAEMPAQLAIRQRLHVGLTVAVTTFIGLSVLLQPLTRRIPDPLGDVLLQFHLPHFDPAWHLVLGFTLLYAAYQLWQRKIAAWWLALGCYLLIFGATLVAVRSLAFALLAGACVALLSLGHPYYRTRFEASSLRRGLIGLAAALIISFAYGVLGFWLLDRRDYGIEFSFGDSLTRTFQEFSLSGNDDLHPRTRYARNFLDSIDIIGVLGLAYGVTSLFQPISFRLRVLPYQRRLMAELLRRHSTPAEGQIKLWPQDKQYFFNADQDAGLAYKVSAGVAIAAGDPVGSNAKVSVLLGLFREYCQSNGWQTAVILASEQLLPLYREAGYREVKIGENAIVDLNHFATKVATDKHFRNVFNRFQRQNIELKVHQPPHSPVLMRQLKAISDAWLKLPGRREFGFLQGYFNQNYLDQNVIFTINDADGRPIAFANQVDPFVNGQATIDLMRHLPDAPPNSMDFLLAAIMLDRKKAGFKTFNLGMAPLSGLKEAAEPGVEEAVLGQIAALADRRIISVEGLRQFKSKFKPHWEGQYLAYEGLPPNLVRLAFALNKAMRPDLLG